MPIKIEVQNDAMGVIYKCTGALTIDDFITANATFLTTPDEILKWRYTLIDLTEAESMIGINYASVSAVVSQNRTIAAKAVSGALLAVASPKSYSFGLARMWETLVEDVGWETMTFRSIPEAEGWIHSRLKQKFGIDLEP